ncbi:MAG: heat-inducible transcriptional repressor HrcA [Christensenellaceae bacterium]|jgi:heat-inducible transcriptional repressor
MGDDCLGISNRQLQILKAIVDEYILTGMPVGSRTIAKREDIGYSSATVRNEMADLEEEGYLEQPHTSAGRMPSEKAYRLYVDTLTQVSSLNEEEIQFIQNYMQMRFAQMENVIDATAKILSELTKLTSIVLIPQQSEAALKRIQLVSISKTKILVVLVFVNGTVKDILIPTTEEIEDAYLEMLSNMLTELVQNQNLSGAVTAIRTAVFHQMKAHSSFLESLLDVALSNMQPKAEKEIVLDGAQNIFNYPEYRDVEKARSFLSLLETKDALYQMLSQASSMEFTIRIGKENEIEELHDMSIVTATYRLGDGQKGSFGVIGPTRMNYARILSVLQFVGTSLNEIFLGYTDKEE